MPNDEEDKKIADFAREIMKETLPKVIDYLGNDEEKFKTNILTEKVSHYFGLSTYALLKTENDREQQYEGRYYWNSQDKSKFYKIKIGENEYFLCNHWVEKKTIDVRKNLENWREKINAKKIEDLLDEIDKIELKEKKRKRGQKILQRHLVHQMRITSHSSIRSSISGHPEPGKVMS